MHSHAGWGPAPARLRLGVPHHPGVLGGCWALALLPVPQRESPAQPEPWRYQRGWDPQSAAARGAGPNPSRRQERGGTLTRLEEATTSLNSPPRHETPRQGGGDPLSTRLLPPAATGTCPHRGRRWQRGFCPPGTSRQVMEVQAGRAAQPGITAGRKRCSVRPTNVLIPFNSPAAPCPCARPPQLGSSFPPPATHTGFFPTSLLGAVLEEGEQKNPAAPKCCKRTS